MTILNPPTAAEGGIRFFGQRSAYWRLLTRGALLLMVTLGIYRFWLTTDVRRFLWGNTEIAGESLEYNGTALELLLGFLVAVAILIPLYTGFFFAALGLGPVAQMSGVLAFLALGVIGQYAVFRARRYRLSRTVYRGLRFHQTGTAGVYALRASLWWTATAVTLGLAYPFQLASLERYKMRHTHYGNLGGGFAGAGWRLLVRGLPMWFLVVAPIALTIGAFLEVVDWEALEEAVAAGGGDMLEQISETNPALLEVAVFAALMVAASLIFALLLYPAFQALKLRWWSSGLRLGGIAMHSALRTRQVYVVYLKFLGLALAFAILAGIVGFIVLAIAGALVGSDEPGTLGEVVATVLLLIAYVIGALGLSTIYRATVMFSLWQLGMEALQLNGLEALDRVRAAGEPSSAVGEGLADALHVGGY